MVRGLTSNVFNDPNHFGRELLLVKLLLLYSLRAWVGRANAQLVCCVYGDGGGGGGCGCVRCGLFVIFGKRWILSGRSSYRRQSILEITKISHRVYFIYFEVDLVERLIWSTTNYCW